MKFIKSLFPEGIRKKLKNIYWLLRFLPYFLILVFKKIKFHNLRLSFLLPLPKEGEFVSGGALKYQYLRKNFGESKRFNFIYLVSSAIDDLPLFILKIFKRLGVKIIWNQNGVAYKAWAGEETDKINNRLRSFISLADQVIYQSQFCKQSADKFLGEVKVPSEIIYNAIDTDFFKAEGKKSLDDFIILLAGSHHQPERVRLAFETLNILREQRVATKIVLAGRCLWPKAEEDLNRWELEFGLKGKIIHRGPYLQSEAPALYNSAHVLLHLQYNDACPSAVVEALACGLPIVGSKSGGMPELIDHLSSGYLIDVPNGYDKMEYPKPGEIAKGILEIKSNYDRYSQAARNRAVDKFDQKKWLKLHENIFNKFLNK